MAKSNTIKEAGNKLPSQLYIAVDHLKEGIYQLNITNKNTIVSSVKFKK